ncbi:MAG TPA: tetratricopeptide repeat protein [Casimicrobiaceae bacterium]|nr:tetratricopeptide repeat protein [Casimicrobiaceae bacterium]
MAVYDLEEQEQIEDLKAWWAQYGKYVSAAVTTVAIIVIGVQGWRWYQGNQSEKASVLYQAVSQAAHANDPAKAKDPAAQLVTQFSGTAYAPRAALLYAKLLYDAGDKAGAKTQLQWTIDHSSEDELKAVARFRLAQVLLDEKAYDDALRTLDAKTDDAFAPLYADLKGDILAAAGKRAEARQAYQTAFTKLDAKSTYRPYVQAKLDALGGPLAPEAGASPAGTPAAGTPAASAPVTPPTAASK